MTKNLLILDDSHEKSLKKEINNVEVAKKFTQKFNEYIAITCFVSKNKHLFQTFLKKKKTIVVLELNYLVIKAKMSTFSKY